MNARRGQLLVVAALMAVLSFSCRTESTERSARAVDPLEFAGIFDTVRIRGADRVTPLDGEFEADLDGEICVPELGWVQIAGLTADEIQSVLQARLREIDTSLEIRVELVDPGNAYFIYGEVAHSGRQELVDGMTLGEAVARAEPCGTGADLSRTSLLRLVPRAHGTESPFWVPIEKIVLSVPIEKSVLRAGDRIFVSSLDDPASRGLPPSPNDLGPRIQIARAASGAH